MLKVIQHCMPVGHSLNVNRATSIQNLTKLTLRSSIIDMALKQIAKCQIYLYIAFLVV